MRPDGGRLLGPLVSQGLAAARCLPLCPRRSCSPALRSPAGLCWPGLPNLAWSPLALIDCGLGLSWSGSFATETLPGKPRVKVRSPGQPAARESAGLPASWGTPPGSEPPERPSLGRDASCSGETYCARAFSAPSPGGVLGAGLGCPVPQSWGTLGAGLGDGSSPPLWVQPRRPPSGSSGSVAAAGSGDGRQGGVRTHGGHGAARQTPQTPEEEIPFPTWAEISLENVGGSGALSGLSWEAAWGLA